MGIPTLNELFGVSIPFIGGMSLAMLPLSIMTGGAIAQFMDLIQGSPNETKLFRKGFTKILNQSFGQIGLPQVAGAGFETPLFDQQGNPTGETINTAQAQALKPFLGAAAAIGTIRAMETGERGQNDRAANLVFNNLVHAGATSQQARAVLGSMLGGNLDTALGRATRAYTGEGNNEGIDSFFAIPGRALNILSSVAPEAVNYGGGVGSIEAATAAFREALKGIFNVFKPELARPEIIEQIIGPAREKLLQTASVNAAGRAETERGNLLDKIYENPQLRNWFSQNEIKPESVSSTDLQATIEEMQARRQDNE